MDKLKFNLSPSSLNKYLESELCFYYQYIEKRKPDTETPACYSLSGNVVHDILDLSKGFYKDPKKAFINLWTKRGLKTELGLNNQILDPQPYWNAIQRGLHLLKHAYTDRSCEERIEFVYSDTIKIVGIIDLIAKYKDGSVTIADWKTSSKVDSSANFERQGKFYATLYYKKYGIIPTKVIFEYLKIDKRKEYVFTKEELDAFWKTLEEVIGGIERKGKDINAYTIGSISSPFNSYKRACNKEIRRRKQLAEESITYPKVEDEGPFTLRDYQKEAISKGLYFFKNTKKQKNSLIIAPTGSGKSLIIAKLAKELGKNVLIFQPSKELLEQNYNKFTMYGGKATLYSASANSKEVGNITYATIGSAIKHPELFQHFEYIIIDEAHSVPPAKESMYSKFFKKLNKPVLGLTATPIRLKQYNYPEPHSKLCMLTRTKPKFFSDYLYIVQIKDMVDKGYLCPCTYKVLDFNKDNLVVNTTGSDYTTASITQSIEEEDTLAKIPDVCAENPDRKHIIIYVPTIKDAEALNKILPNSAFIHSKINKKNRETILNDFKEGKTKCMINVGILILGFDYPEVDMIVLARPTLSLVVYYQSIGRAVRPHASKKDALVVDLVGNYNRFGAIKELTVEECASGWAMCSGDNLLTGVPMGLED